MSDNATLTPSAFVPPTPTEFNAMVGPHLEVQECIGQGGMGAIYRACQSRLRRDVAVKLLPPIPRTEGWDFEERFAQEARAMARLRHPGIVTIHDFGETGNGMPYFVMEYVDGSDLHSLIQGGRLSAEHITSWIPQVAEALAYAHGHDLVHRDIKPANLMVTNEGQVKITDFGLVKVNGGPGRAGLTQARLSVGTPNYLAPEAAESGAEVDHRADIFSLGVVLYEMLTGKVPRGAWRPPSKCGREIDPRFDAIVTKAMQENREDRYDDIREIGDEVLAIGSTPRPKVLLKCPSGPGPKALQTAPLKTEALPGLILEP